MNGMKMERALTQNESKEISATELCWELQVVSSRVPRKSTLKDVLDFICNLRTGFSKSTLNELVSNFSKLKAKKNENVIFSFFYSVSVYLFIF